MAIARFQFPISFLSTPSARRATSNALISFLTLASFLSTPSARRATISPGFLLSYSLYFYPRPPRGGRHNTHRTGSTRLSNFYPRPPRGGRLLNLTPFPLAMDFYPRPPRGGRLFHCIFCSTLALFLSTPSARRATTAVFRRNPRSQYFYPRPPRGGRQWVKSR